MSESFWLPAPKKLVLSRNEIHVWRAQLDLPNVAKERHLGLLSEDEMNRARSYRFSSDRERYSAGRAALRIILSRYVGISARQLRFEYNSYGKPSLCTDANYPCQFNLSHSQNLALISITQQNAVGIDIERMKTGIDFTKIARRFFSTQEQNALVSLSQEEVPRAFYRCWTRKEAYIKAMGMGLSLPLESFSVSLEPDQPPIILHGETDQTEAWSLYELVPAENYVAAVAISGTDYELRYFEWIAE